MLPLTGMEIPSSISIRSATSTDAQSVLEVHRSAVLKTAGDRYDRNTLDAWAASLDSSNIERMAAIIITQSELVLVAEIDKRIIGFGSIVPATRELRAVYVDPDFGRAGVGGQLLTALEEFARQRHLSELTMDASLNAEDFYRQHGFAVVERGDHLLPGGERMGCVRMRKALDLS